MKSLLRKLGDIHPLFYGSIYLICIPFFGLILHYIGCFELTHNNNPISDLSSSIYFSAVTITTLGFGDIIPSNIATRIVVIVEASIGVVLAGLFLNALAYQQSRIIHEADKKEFEKIEFNKRLNKLISFNKLIQLNLEQYEFYIILMTSPYGSAARPLGDKKPVFKLNPNFTFHDLKHLYHSTGKLTDSHYAPTVQYFYNALDQLVSSLEKAFSLDLFSDHKDLEKEVRDFILLTRTLNSRDIILEQFNTRIGNIEAIDYYEKLIESLPPENIKLHPSNMMNPFVILFYLINESCSFNEIYKFHLNTIKSQENIK